MKNFTLALCTVFFSFSLFAKPQIVIDVYKVLGVANTVTDKDLKSAFRKLVSEFMPRAINGERLATEKLVEINEAWAKVKTPDLRRAYDISLKSQPSSQSRQDTAQPFDSSNLDEVLANNPDWAAILKDMNQGIDSLFSQQDWPKLMKMYQTIIDDKFFRIFFITLAKLENTAKVQSFIQQILDYEINFGKSILNRESNLSFLISNVFSQEKFSDLTNKLLPKLIFNLNRFELRVLVIYFFSKPFSVLNNNEHLWEIFRKTQAEEEDQGTFSFIAQWAFVNFPDDVSGLQHDPEMLVAMIKLDERDVNTVRPVAWSFKPMWGGRALYAIIERNDADAIKGVKERLNDPEFAHKDWDVFRKALLQTEMLPKEFLALNLGPLELFIPEKEIVNACEGFLATKSINKRKSSKGLPSPHL